MIAIGAEVWIYQPSYPLQELGGEPSLKLRLPKSSGAKRGFLDPSHPHNVNHLVVAFLGVEEIFLVTCDDGDVLGFRIDEIQQAIELRREPNCPKTIHGNDVRHFFLENVGKSAWGLAVHTEARKIAVSSNTHCVTVFEFGLASKDEEREEQQFSDDTGPPLSPSSRYKDRSYILSGQRENIPCVTFCNTGEDPDGRFLACGDITGVTYIWDLHLRRMLETDQVGFCTANFKGQSPDCHCSMSYIREFPHSGQSNSLITYDVFCILPLKILHCKLLPFLMTDFDVVWGLAWLDKTSFRKLPDSASQLHVFDCLPEMDKPRSLFKPWTVSHMRESVPNSASSFTPPSLRRGSRLRAQPATTDQQEQNFMSEPFDVELEDDDELSDTIDNEEQQIEDEVVENVLCAPFSDSSSSDIDISSDETEDENNGGVSLTQESEQASNLVEDAHTAVHESELGQEQGQVVEDIQEDSDDMLVDGLDVEMDDIIRRAPLPYD